MTRLFIVCMTALVSWSTAHAASVNHRIIAEMDPVAPASAAYEEKSNGVTTSKFGAGVDFNVGGVISTGPEIWSGSFLTKGGDPSTQLIRREDFYPGERQKINATRLRWTFALWEVPSAMRGWYVKTGYSYTRVDSRANRYTEHSPGGDALPQGTWYQDPDAETDLVTDERHGAILAFGNRWLLMGDALTLTVGVSLTSNFRRALAVDSSDPRARSDYEHMIAELPDTRISERPTPETNLAIGYAW